MIVLFVLFWTSEDSSEGMSFSMQGHLKSFTRVHFIGNSRSLLKIIIYLSFRLVKW